MKNIFVVLAFFVASVFNVSFAQEADNDAPTVSGYVVLESLEYNKVFKANTQKELFKIVYGETYNPKDKVMKNLFISFIGDNQVVLRVEGGYLIFPPSQYQTQPQFYSKGILKKLLR